MEAHRIRAVIAALDKIIWPDLSPWHLKNHCWIWRGSLSSSGWQPVVHTQIRWRNAELNVMRLLYEAEFDTDLAAHVRLNRKCDTLDCVNPYHFSAGLDHDE